jgi:hypothetical protein
LFSTFSANIEMLKSKIMLNCFDKQWRCKCVYLIYLLYIQGFEVILPDRATMEHTVIPAIEALSRKDMEGACNLLRIALQVLLVRAVNFVILASDEMRDVLPHDDPLLKKCIDPMDALARSTIKWVRSSGDNT